MALEGEKLAILQARKLAKYYGRYLPQRQAFTVAMQQAETYAACVELVNNWFDVCAEGLL